MQVTGGPGRHPHCAKAVDVKPGRPTHVRTWQPPEVNIEGSKAPILAPTGERPLHPSPSPGRVLKHSRERRIGRFPSLGLQALPRIPEGKGKLGARLEEGPDASIGIGSGIHWDPQGLSKHGQESKHHHTVIPRSAGAPRHNVGTSAQESMFFELLQTK